MFGLLAVGVLFVCVCCLFTLTVAVGYCLFFVCAIGLLDLFV